jgi:hypothetical protein
MHADAAPVVEVIHASSTILRTPWPAHALMSSFSARDVTVVAIVIYTID